ncbi:MAG: polysaccharide deacetylase family protein [Bacteroidales bacterium]|nr:polysaccharide deacetylase family protein [Bacteroidales bacterium]
MKPQLLIHSSRITNRLRYTLDLVLTEQLGIDYELTTDMARYLLWEGAALAYGTQAPGKGAFLQNVSLLFEREINSLELKAFDYEGVKAFFPIYNKKSILPFDVLAAVFYLVSRYEEYLPFVRDQHGRFDAASSVLFELKVLDKPIVNLWIIQLEKRLKEVFPGIEIRRKSYRFIPTYDIDAAWAYQHKGLIRTMGAYMKDLVKADFSEMKSRTAVLRGKANDPFDTFHLQLSLQQQYKLRPVYFILFAAYGHNDKNISVRNRHFQQLIKYLGDYADIGIHPSYASYSNKQLLKHELNQLSAILNREVSCSRQHFLRMSLPETYQNLIEHNILNDYTMGYAAMPGFRAGIADDFYFYDLDHEVKTALRIHPFAVMDGTLRDYMQLDAEEAVSKAEDLINSVKAVNGKFILLWHNETLSDQKRWTGWRKVYQNLVESALP